MNRKFIHIVLALTTAQIVGAQSLFLKQVVKEVQIPYEITGDFLILDVSFKNVLPLKFIFDTGSEHTILFKKEYSDLLGVRYQKRIPLMGSDLSKEIYGYIARGIPLNIENSAMVTTDILVLEEDYLGLEEFTGINIDGIIGANIFRHFITFINTKKGRIHLIKPDKFQPPKNYIQIPISVYKNKPYLNATARIGRNLVDLRLLMDTGAGLPLLLYTNSHPDLSLPEHTIPGNLGMGLGGNLKGYIGRADEFSFSEYDYANLITSFQEFNIDSVANLRLNRNGIVGNSLLSRFNYYIDYYREMVYIKPLRRFKRKFNFDKSGLIIAATGRNLRDFVVQSIIPDSPAEEAGIQVGDLIKKVQGLPTSFFSLTALNSLLSGRENKNIRIILAREDEKHKIKFKLRTLI